MVTDEGPNLPWRLTLVRGGREMELGRYGDGCEANREFLDWQAPNRLLVAGDILTLFHRGIVENQHVCLNMAGRKS